MANEEREVEEVTRMLADVIDRKLSPLIKGDDGAVLLWGLAIAWYGMSLALSSQVLKVDAALAEKELRILVEKAISGNDAINKRGASTLSFGRA